jgi:hypothetical protein
MLEERKFEGYWWRPSEPENKVPGTLSFSQSDVRLELLGAFEEIKCEHLSPQAVAPLPPGKCLAAAGAVGHGQPVAPRRRTSSGRTDGSPLPSP